MARGAVIARVYVASVQMSCKERAKIEMQSFIVDYRKSDYHEQ